MNAYSFKYEITPSLKENDRLKISQYTALNNAREKGKTRRKISYKVLKKEDECDPFLDIYPYPTLIQLEDYPGGIHYCATVVGKCIFESNLPFAIPLTKEIFYYCCINENETKEINGYKGLSK